MRKISWLATVLALAGCATSAPPEATFPIQTLEPTAKEVIEPEVPLAAQASWREDPAAADDVARALDPDPAASQAGVAALRARGQAGLDALLAALGERAALDPAARAVVARTAAQLDAHASGLFWHTDRREALARAAKEHKPVLSLRLLGRLDEELSCANSRFFRTAVYPNAEVAKHLREGYVLHWSSERPAPRITIDFGDGRKLERTITGNSLHYVLDAQGRVVDALPGLYGARAFVRTLERSRALASAGVTLDAATWNMSLREHHSANLSGILSSWQGELARFGITFGPPAEPGEAPSAALAAGLTMPKMAVEAPLVAAVLPSADELEQRTDAAAWRQLGIRALDDARLDGTSRALIRSKRPMQATSDGARPIDGAALDRLFLALEVRVAEDSVRNEMTFHRRVHEWLAAAPLDFEALNQRVYAELFLTPRSDPWLGLMPADAFTGLTNDGVELGQR
jgi:hypothetical protein